MESVGDADGQWILGSIQEAGQRRQEQTAGQARSDEKIFVGQELREPVLPTSCRGGLGTVSIVPDTGIKPAIEQIDSEIDEDDHRGHKEHDTLDDREVAGANGPQN